VDVRLRLYPPLSDTAGAVEVRLEVNEPATLRNVVEALVARFGNGMRLHLFDTEGRIIPSWAVFVNQKIVPFNQPGALEVPVKEKDEVSFILNIAGG
jgi:molybdopterin converting factor small subunit